MAIGHYLLGRTWGVGLKKLEKKADFRQKQLDEFLSSIKTLDGFGKIFKRSLYVKESQKKGGNSSNSNDYHEVFFEEHRCFKP